MDNSPDQDNALSPDLETFEGRVKAIRQYGLIVTATETQPTRQGKQPKPVWNICGITSSQLSRYEQILRDEMGLKKWKGQFSAWSDPTEELLDLLESTEQLGITDVHQHQADRSEERAERLETRARKHQATAQGHLDRAHQFSERFAGGQPILRGHHSERSARRDQEKMWASTERGMQELNYADHLNSRAQASAGHAERKTQYTIEYVGNRLEEARAELRAIEREQSVQSYCTVRVIASGRQGQCFAVTSKGKVAQARVEFSDTVAESSDPSDPVCTTKLRLNSADGLNDWAEFPIDALERVISPTKQNDLALRRQAAEQDIQAWEAVFAELGGNRFTPETIKVGDYVRTQFGWKQVLKVNKKTLGVPSGYSWMNKLPYHEVRDHITAEEFAERKAQAEAQAQQKADNAQP